MPIISGTTRPMAVYACTLVIKDTSDRSARTLLTAMLPWISGNYYKVGKDNATYFEAINTNSDSLYIARTDKFVVVAGFPLIQLYTYINAFSLVFPAAEYFFVFSEAVSMLNGFVYGKGRNTLRRKYVRDGEYVKVFDITPDEGQLLPEERKIYYPSARPGLRAVRGGLSQIGTTNSNNETSEPNHLESKEYMSGEHDLSIGMDFLERIFFNEEANSFLEKLIFNQDISALPASGEPINTEQVEEKIKALIDPVIKAKGFEKIDYPGQDGQISPVGYYKDVSDGRLLLIPGIDKESMKFNYSFCIDSDKFNAELGQKLIRNGQYGIPVMSIQPLTLLKLDERYNGKQITSNELSIMAEWVSWETEELKRIISIAEKVGISRLLDDPLHEEFCLAKLRNEADKFGKIMSEDDINFCLAYYYYSHSYGYTDLTRIIDKVYDPGWLEKMVIRFVDEELRN